jgi:FkbM family methyltransferase
MYPRLPFLVLPYTRAELPGWRIPLTLTGGLVSVADTRWQNAPKVTIRGKNHGYLMELELSDWAERYTFFLGRYYEMGVQRVLDAILMPGDRFVDIGANIGMIALHARSLVGSAGRIDCFEPNPECVERLRRHLQLNNIQNVTIHICALSDKAGKSTLNLSSEHSGTATLTEVDDVKRTLPVTVCVGDDLLMEGPVINVMKVDVEGYEMKVLSGLTRTLEKFRPIIITELIEAHIHRAGSSVAAVTQLLGTLGYVPLGIGTVRKGIRHRLALSRSLKSCNDAVWIHTDDARSARLSKFIR